MQKKTNPNEPVYVFDSKLYFSKVVLHSNIFIWIFTLKYINSTIAKLLID